MNTYPSPDCEEMDSSEHFFARNSQPRQMEHEHNLKVDQPGAPPPQEQTPQESQADINPHDVRELQLAAQLGQDLAGSVSSMPPATSAEMAIDNLAASDSNLRAILPYPDADQEAQAHHVPAHPSVSGRESEPAGQIPHYESERQQSEQLTLAMPTALDHLQGSAQYTTAETPPRKRSKVSRACDECRRKKVKCDAQTDAGDMPCSSCKRSNIQCLFSRIPQKRGPSKGYIKELADRIGSIEQLVQAPGEDRALKRSFSTMSIGEAATTPVQSRPTPWSVEQRGSQSLQPASAPPPERYQTPYSPNDLAPSLTTSPQQENTPSTRLSATVAPTVQSGTGRSVDAGVFSGYLTAIHSHLPFLTETREELEVQLSKCPAGLQDAFTEALCGTVASFPPQPTRTFDMHRAHQKLNEFSSTNSLGGMEPWQLLTYVQALVLMTIEADNRALSASGPSKDVLLSAAIKGARRGHMNIYKFKGSGAAPDILRLRTWCVLVVLDRLDGVSTGCRSSIQGDFIPPSNLKQLLGENLYHLLRFTEVLEPISGLSSLIQDAVSPQTPLENELLKMLPMMIEKERVELPDHIEPSHFPLVHLAYWHARLLVYLFDTKVTSDIVMHVCKNLAVLLIDNASLLSPLNHHFTILVTLVLLELAKVDAQRDQARTHLSDLINNPIAPSTWNSHVKGIITDKLAGGSTSDVEQTARESLQRLADVATGRGSGSGSGSGSGKAKGGAPTLEEAQQYTKLGFNPMPLLHAGYVSVMRETL